MATIGVQGIRQISTILGVEATRDLETETFHGVGPGLEKHPFASGRSQLSHQTDRELQLLRLLDPRSNHELD